MCADLVVAVGLSLDDLVARIEVEGVLDGEGVVEGARVEREAAAVPGDLRRVEELLTYRVSYLLAARDWVGFGLTLKDVRYFAILPGKYVTVPNSWEPLLYTIIVYKIQCSFHLRLSIRWR